MTSLGASMVVDYNDVDWIEQIKQWHPSGVDAAIAIQPNTGISGVEVVKSDGKIIAVSGDQVVLKRNITVEQIAYHIDVKEELIQLLDKVVTGEFKLVIE